MEASQLCQMREGFLGQWRQAYPCVPPPSLNELDQVRETDIIDEARSTELTTKVLRSLNAVHNKIALLNEQVKRKIRLRDFYVDLLSELDRKECERWISQSIDPDPFRTDVNKLPKLHATSVPCFCSPTPHKQSECSQGVYPSERSVGVKSSVPVETWPVCCQQTKLPPLSSPTTVNRDGGRGRGQVVVELSGSNTSNSHTNTNSDTKSKSCLSCLSSRKDTVDSGIQCDLVLACEVIRCENYTQPTSTEPCLSKEEIQEDSFITARDVNTPNSSLEVTASRRSNTEVSAKANSFKDTSHSSSLVSSASSEVGTGNEDDVYDNVGNITVINCGGDMFRHHKKSGGSKGSGSKGSGDGGGGSVSGRRGSKDNFMAVTSKRRVSHEEPSQSIRLKDHSPSGSPLLTRNFQLLKLTSGFDLVLGDDDEEKHKDVTVDDRDDDAVSLNSVDADSDYSKNSPDARRAPPRKDDVTISTPLEKTTKQMGTSVNSLAANAARGEKGLLLNRPTSQPDLIQSVSITPSQEHSSHHHGATGDNSSDKTKKTDEDNKLIDHKNTMPVMDTRESVPPSPPRRDSSSKNKTPPPPVKPRTRSLMKKGSPPLPVPAPRPKEDAGVGVEIEYTDDDLLEALANGSDSSSSTARKTETHSAGENRISWKHRGNDNSSQGKTTDVSVTNSPDKGDASPSVLRERRSPRAVSPSSLSTSPSMASDFKSMLTTTIVSVPRASENVSQVKGLEDPSRNSTFYVNLDSPVNAPHSSSPSLPSSSSFSSSLSPSSSSPSLHPTEPNSNSAYTNSTPIGAGQIPPPPTTTPITSSSGGDRAVEAKGAAFLPHQSSERSRSSLPQQDGQAEVSREGESESSQRSLKSREKSVSHVQSDQERESNLNTGSDRQEPHTHSETAEGRKAFLVDEENQHKQDDLDLDLDLDSENSVVELRKGDGAFHCDRLSSDTSLETLVPKDECLRSVSCISDADVRAAISAFDAVVISADTDTPSSDSDSRKPPGKMHSTRKRRSSTPSYVNWTINRALTTSIHSRDLESTSDDLASEEDTNLLTTDEDSCGGGCISLPSPEFHRPTPSHGSKDSGLCDDISVSDSLHSDLDLGRITDLRQIQEMERWEEEEEAAKKEGLGVGLGVAGEAMDLHHEDKDYDSVSVTSDIVFLPNTPDTDTPNQLLPGEEADDTTDGKVDNGQHDHQDHQQDHQLLDSASLTSSVEDDAEHDSSSCVNTSYDEIDSGRDGMLKMRQLLVKGVLDSEKSFLNILDLLIKYKNLLQASSESSQAVISKEDIAAIFGNIESLHSIHLDFVKGLEPKVANWTHAEQIGENFKILVFNFSEFVKYVNNYHNAVNAIHRCSQENDRFHDLAQHIIVNSTKEATSLEDALFKPVQRVQRNTLVLHDLIKCTPEDHPDYEALQKALKLSQHNLENYEAAVSPASIRHENKHLVKNSFLVELVNGMRKLRYVFLFNDILVCTKRETHRNKKVSYVIKWFAHLADTSFDTKFEYKDDAKYSNTEEIEKLKFNIREVKKDLKSEMKKLDVKDKHRSLVSLGGGTRAIEKLRKKLNQYEGQLILSSPRLPFKVSLDGGKEYTMLMTTDYEREEWKESLQFLCKKCTKKDHPVSSISVQDLINSVKETPQVNKIGNVLLQTDEDALMGTLNINIHKMNGLTKECDTYCCLEMDSFGHFFMMAKTRVCEASRDPIWNEDFELELDGSQTLRILCFKKGGEEDGDALLGRGALELDRQWLRGSFQEKTVSMNEISLVISVRHTPPEKTMQRTPSRVINACFGVKISSSAKREGKPVPMIVTACIQEVEKRGLDEVGIYRVSGVTSDLQRIKKLFDKNIRSGAEALKDVDIHAVTGILKMYLRELPEPLFTEALYQNFIDTLRLSDDEAKAQCLLSLYHSLPDANYYTSVCILEHLVNVARNVGKNKMSINNLSTIFGPTLLAPAVKDTNIDPLEMMFKGTEQAMYQASFINYMLALAVSGRSLRKSAV